jgi:hypothetical protein
MGLPLKLKLKLKLIYDRRSVGQSVLVSSTHLEPMIIFLFSVLKWQVSWCGTPYMTRGLVCNLLVQLLLGLFRAVTLESKSRRTHDLIALSHMRLPQPGKPGPRIYIPPPKNNVAQLYPRALGSFSLPLTTRRAGGIVTRLHTRNGVRKKSEFSYDLQSVGQSVLVWGHNQGP